MKNSTLKRLYNTSKSKNIYILILAITHCFNGIIGVVYALLLKNIVDSAIKQNIRSFWQYVISIILLVLVQIIIRAIIRWINELAKTTYENLFKSRFINNLLYKEYSSVSAIHTEEWLNRLTNDAVIVANNYVEILPGMLEMIVKLISAIIMILILDWNFAGIIFICGIILIVFTYIFRKVLKRLHKIVQEKDGSFRIFIQEHISSMMLVRSFSAEKQIEEEAKEKMNEHKNARIKKNIFSNICNIGFSVAMNGIYIFGVCYCGYGIIIGKISYGTLIAITQLISQVQSPFANITGYLQKYYVMIASAERLMEIEKLNDEKSNKITDIKKINNYYSKKFEAFGLKNARFKYYATANNLKNITKDDMPNIINEFNMEIKKGEFVAFTGSSGCGKSTILKLLMSIYKLDEGNRYIKEIDGNCIELTADWRRLFAYVPQGNHLISGTIREIVAFSDKKKINDDEKIYNALKIACSDKFVKDLEFGLDTYLGEKGSGISEGQKQRIAIARAIFSESPILLLDEATSALDAKTEKELLINLKKMTNKTVIIVTHRSAALKVCNRIINFNDFEKNSNCK